MSTKSAKANIFQKRITALDDLEEIIKNDLIRRMNAGQHNNPSPRGCDNEDSLGSADIIDLDSLERLKITCSLDGFFGQQDAESNSLSQQQPQSELDNGWEPEKGQASPARMAQASPASMAQQASPARMAQASPASMAQASPARVAQASPASVAQASPASVAKQDKNNAGPKVNVASQRYSSRDKLADIVDVITANGLSEHYTNGSDENASKKSSSSGQPNKRASDAAGRMTPSNIFYLETSPGQRSEDDLIDLIQLEEGSLNLLPFDGDSDSPQSVRSSDTLQAFEVEGQSSLCYIEYNDDSIDSLEQFDQCNSILVEKGGKRGRPARQKPIRPTQLQPILPRPPLSSGLMTNGPYHVPQRTVCTRLDCSFSTPSPQTSTRSRDNSSTTSSCTTDSSRRSSSDTEGLHNARHNNGTSSVNSCQLPFVNVTSHSQIRTLGSVEQPFYGGTYINNSSNMMYPSNTHNQIYTMPLNSGQPGLYGSGHHGMRPQHQPATGDRDETGNGTVPQHYNPHTHPAPANHLVAPSEVLPQNIAVLNQAHMFQLLEPSYGMHEGTAMQSSMNGHGFVPSMTDSRAIGNHLNTRKHFSPPMTNSNNSALPQNSCPYQVGQKHPPKEKLAYGVSNHGSASSSGFVNCNISSNPTRPNEKPKLDLPYEKKDSIVSQWINANVGDPSPDSGYYPNQSFIDYGNVELQKQSKSNGSSKRQSSKGSPGRSPMRNNASTSDMSFTSSPSSFKLDRANPNSEMLSGDRQKMGLNSFPHLPLCPGPQSEFENVMPKSSIEEVEKINADLEIEINIIEMKEKSLENHKTGLSLPADCVTKLSSLEAMWLNDEADLSLLPGAGLSASQFSNSSSFDRSKYLTPNDISSLEAKKHQSGKTSFDEYLGNAVAMSHTNESVQKASNGHGHPVYYNPAVWPEAGGFTRTDPTAKESSNKSNSQQISKPIKRKPEETKSAMNFLPDPACSTFTHFIGGMYQQEIHSRPSRRGWVEQWINGLPDRRNSSESQCFSSYQQASQAQAINAQCAQSISSPNGLMSSWTEAKMSSGRLPNQHPVSTSDASMMSETCMSIENSLSQLEEHHHNALMNGFLDVVDMAIMSVGSNEPSGRQSANCDSGNKQCMDDYHFNKVMNFLEPDIPPSMGISQSALVFPDTVPPLSNTNSCNYLRNHLLQQTSNQPVSGRHQVSPFACAMPSFDDGLSLSPRGPPGPSAGKATVKAAETGPSNVQNPAGGDQQPAEITISSLDSSKISGDSYLSKLSYGSIPEQVMGPDSDGETCLHFLCDMPPGSIAEIKQQPGFREALDLQNKKHETALFIAVKRSNVEITNFLLSNGANPNIICSSHVQGLGALQHSALHEAVLAGNLRIVRALLSTKDIVVDAKSSYKGQTPLMLALSFHKTSKEKDIIMLLIEKKASLTIQETQGRTPLMLAIQSRDVSLVETILTMVGPVTARALVTAADKKGLTCLHIAAGLSLNTQDKKRLLQCIITAGGDASVKNIEGETPRDWAKNEITEVLQNLAKVNKT